MWSTPAPSASSITTCERGLVADREEFLRNGLRGGEEAGAQSGRGNDGTADLHGWDDIFSTPMPTYVYKFVDTGETIEVQQAFTDATLTEVAHPDSGEVLPVKKVFTPVGVTFKGMRLLQDRQSRKKSSKSEIEPVQGCGVQGSRPRIRRGRAPTPIGPSRSRHRPGRRTVGSSSSAPSSSGKTRQLVVHEAGERLDVHDDLMLIPLADQATDLGAEVGVFGGSGFYEFLDDCTEIEMATPSGHPLHR